jgi:hypothetical protein
MNAPKLGEKGIEQTNKEPAWRQAGKEKRISNKEPAYRQAGKELRTLKCKSLDLAWLCEKTGLK